MNRKQSRKDKFHRKGEHKTPLVALGGPSLQKEKRLNLLEGGILRKNFPGRGPSDRAPEEGGVGGGGKIEIDSAQGKGTILRKP